MFKQGRRRMGNIPEEIYCSHSISRLSEYIIQAHNRLCGAPWSHCPLQLQFHLPSHGNSTSKLNSLIFHQHSPHFTTEHARLIHKMPRYNTGWFDSLLAVVGPILSKNPSISTDEACQKLESSKSSSSVIASFENIPGKTS